MSEVLIPQPLRWLVFQTFGLMIGANFHDASLPLDTYETLNQLFTRRLKSGARSIESDRIHPVDAELLSVQRLAQSSSQLLQAKGFEYSSSEFLGPLFPSLNLSQTSYLVFTYYLSPRHYHRVHAPTSGELVEVFYMPGRLWSVMPSLLTMVPSLYVRNERMLFRMDCQGQVAVIAMVGALNVGRIECTANPDWTHEVWQNPQKAARWSGSHSLGVGAELGCFHMGSSVLLFIPENWVAGGFEASREVCAGFELMAGFKPQEVRMGQSLLTNCRRSQ